nr:MAG TPA: hypothetical protein [Caudoviricetes sp.]
MAKDVLTTKLLAKSKPAVIEDLNNGQGSFLYNHNIVEVDVEESEMGGVTVTTDPGKATGKMFQYDSVRCEYPKTADNIFGTLLQAKYPTDKESKLVNEYQSAVIGIMAPDAKVGYENFLRDRLAIRNMVDGDCETLNIPTDL